MDCQQFDDYAKIGIEDQLARKTYGRLPHLFVTVGDDRVETNAQTS
jgi:hypothetical protein